MLKKETKFTIAIIIQLVILFSIIIFKVAILVGGREVLLEVVPVDPRDPLRGDHLTFQYEISSINSYLFAFSPKYGDTIYVPLENRGKYWVATSRIKKTKPRDTGKIFIKGRVSDIYRDRVQVIYGIEDYFIPEGTGQGFNWRREVSAKVIVDEDGNAVLKQIYVDNRPWP